MEVAQKKSVWSKIIIVALILSVFMNIIGFFTMVVIVQYDDDLYNSLDKKWCENTNNWIEYSNNLLLYLKYYDSEYEEMELTEQVDCWGIEEDGEVWQN